MSNGEVKNDRLTIGVFDGHQTPLEDRQHWRRTLDDVQTQSALYIKAPASETTSHRPDARAMQLYIVPCIDLQETTSANMPPKRFYHELL
jgi:hypothetical protein